MPLALEGEEETRERAQFPRLSASREEKPHEHACLPAGVEPRRTPPDRALAARPAVGRRVSQGAADKFRSYRRRLTGPRPQSRPRAALPLRHPPLWTRGMTSALSIWRGRRLSGILHKHGHSLLYMGAELSQLAADR